jgi:hypothetical protein
MTRLFRRFAILLAAAACLALPAAAADDALSLVPANAVTVGKVHLAAMRTSPLSSMLFEHIDRMTADGEARTILLEAGLQPLQDVDAVVVATSPRTALGSEADVLVIAEGRFQPARLTSLLVARGAINKGSYLLLDDPQPNEENGAVAFVSPSLVIAGNERSVVNALAARAAGGTGFAARGALAAALGLVDGDATAWGLVDVPRAARLAKAGEIETGNGQTGAALQAALASVSTVAVWARDTGEALELAAKGFSTDGETLQLLEDAARGALATMRILASDKAPEMVPILRAFDVDRRSDSITVEGSIPAGTLRDLIAKRLSVARK